VNRSLSLKRNNIGVLLFNALEDGEEIEYTYDIATPRKSIKRERESYFQNKFIILDNEDIPPGKTKTLYLRYKNQPETEIEISIRGIEDLTQTSIFKIIAGFLLASLLFGIFYFFNRRRIKKKLSQLNQKNKTIETQLSLLSGQLNPHFLFNTLHAIQGTIINNETDVANKYISNVAHFMRRVMDDGKKEFVSLHEELKLEEDYLKLEQQRKHFTYNISLDPALNNMPIDFPPLLLQPVLENAIRHGLTSTVVNPHIEMNITKEESDLIVQITDNGHYWEVNKRNEGTGLSLVHKRINLYNEKLAPLHISMHITYDNRTISTFTFKNWLA
jgi:phosphoglycerate-specific signal transduction histidine kinase